MFQGGGAWSGVRAKEMLRHVARCTHIRSTSTCSAERVGLGDCGRTPYRRLSGGRRRRLGLAMAMVGRPEIAFVDEPTAGMDPAARRTTWELLEELRAAGVTVVLTTHYMDEAERLADRIHIIDHGRLIASGTPLELTRGGRVTTIRLVVTKPFPAGRTKVAPTGAGDRVEVTELDELSLRRHRTGRRLEPGRGLAVVQDNGVLPESLTLGQRNLEDVFLELTGREMAVMNLGSVTPRPGAAPFAREVLAQASMESRLMLRTARSCCSPW